MKKIAIIAASIVVVLVLAGLLLPSLAWDGGANIQFRFHVVESGDTRPVKDARIRVIRDSQLQSLSDTNFAGLFPVQTTDSTGSAAVSVLCGAGGSTGLFGEADGYRPLFTGLANVGGGRGWPLSKRDFDVELVLFKNP